MLNKTVHPRPSCADDFDAESISVDAARQRILDRTSPVSDTETLRLRDALNRVLARDVVSGIDVPGHTNSAMDGYALAGAGLPDKTPRTYEVVGAAYAGHPYRGHCSKCQCVRIMTGAAMPAGTDTVVMQEHVEKLGDNTIQIPAGQRQHQNVRLAGEDIRKGSAVLHAGRRLIAADLGVIASLGIGEITVYRKPRIAFFSTGDELRPVGKPLDDGDIYDSNRYSLFGMLSQLDVDILDLGIVRDTRQAIREAFRTASDQADIVITSGGVSVGEADFVKQSVTETGEIHIWKIAMKPGRPLAFGRVGNAAFFGLPGNPVSVMTTFYQFVLPAIQRRSGQADVRPLTIRVRCIADLRKRPGRFEFQRGILSFDDTGQLTVGVTGRQGSGILTSMSRANCLILLDDNCGGVNEGDYVTVQPLNLFL